jgi:phosphatidylglycerol lysyltransferase
MSHSRRASGPGGRVKGIALWAIGHASRAWPVIALGVVLAATWETLRGIHPHAVRQALLGMDVTWLWIAAALTAVNIAVLGLYDVAAFRHTRTRPIERWRYGAVAFAWSNFLTLGPLAGPAVRFWLYRPSIDTTADLEIGVVIVGLGFTSGLAGWMTASLLAAQWGVAAMAAVAFAIAAVAGTAGAAIVRRIGRYATAATTIRAGELALVGWLDWVFAAAAFLACVRATDPALPVAPVVRSFFLGQAVGLLSLVPGGFGTADAFWIAHLPEPSPAAAAMLLVYRAIYYVAPWILASLLMLSWASRRATKRLELARRTIAGLVGGGGLLMILSSASPAVHARLLMIERVVPLSLVEAGHVTAALAGVLLLVLARGLSRGYAAAHRATLVLLGLAGIAAMLKGFDYEEATILAIVAVAAASQAALFDRPSAGDWIEGADLAIAAGAVALFVLFGIVSHHPGPQVLQRWATIGYGHEAARFVRSAASLMLGVAAATLYVVLRVPVRFTPPSAAEIEETIRRSADHGGNTSLLTVANGDKSVFTADGRGLCLYRTIGPYLVVFSDPAVRASRDDRVAFLDALFEFAGEVDRRPLFYQVSPEWIPPLHDRGYLFFKLGEEAHVVLDRVTLEGSAGKTNRTILRRAERDGHRFRVLDPCAVPDAIPELREVSDDWLRSKSVRERQFSIGYFDEAYLRRYPCAVVEEAAPPHRIIAFANVLADPHGKEIAIDLMRYRRGATGAMDFLFVSLFLYGRDRGFERFNMGMAPLSSVGEQHGAHGRERLANLLFQHGEHWYNFRGLRFYKQKWNPEWVPRYLAYQDAWEFPMAILNVSALIAGGWTRILRGAA